MATIKTHIGAQEGGGVETDAEERKADVGRQAGLIRAHQDAPRNRQSEGKGEPVGRTLVEPWRRRNCPGLTESAEISPRSAGSIGAGSRLCCFTP